MVINCSITIILKMLNNSVTFRSNIVYNTSKFIEKLFDSQSAFKHIASHSATGYL